jgi:hypothetical protein
VAEVDHLGDPVTLVQDTDPPRTTITSAPPSTVVARGSTPATFTFSASENFVTFQCRLDGGAFAPCTSPVTYTNLEEGNHVFTVRATDATGNVEASPPAASWLLAIDRDGDGFTRFSNPPDCNESDPNVHPGAGEPRGGHVDVDCDGAIDPFLTIRPRVRFFATVAGRFTRLTSLTVSAVPAGATVDVSCLSRRHCPIHHKSIKVSNGNGTLSFASMFRRLRLPAGFALAIRVTAPESIGAYTALVMRKAALPLEHTGCLSPGQSKPQSACSEFG